MTAVGMNLAADLTLEDLAPELDPAGAAGKFRHGQSDHIERQRFPGEVRVGAEVVGEVLLDVRQLTIEADDQIHEPRCAVGADG